MLSRCLAEQCPIFTLIPAQPAKGRDPLTLAFARSKHWVSDEGAVQQPGIDVDFTGHSASDPRLPGALNRSGLKVRCRRQGSRQPRSGHPFTRSGLPRLGKLWVIERIAERLRRIVGRCRAEERSRTAQKSPAAQRAVECAAIRFHCQDHGST